MIILSIKVSGKSTHSIICWYMYAAALLYLLVSSLVKQYLFFFFFRKSKTNNVLSQQSLNSSKAANISLSNNHICILKWRQDSFVVFVFVKWKIGGCSLFICWVWGEKINLSKKVTSPPHSYISNRKQKSPVKPIPGSPSYASLTIISEVMCGAWHGKRKSCKHPSRRH